MSQWPISVEEFCERYEPVTRWPFSLAISISMVVHVLFFAAIIVWYKPDGGSTSTMSAPIFDVSLSRSNATEDSGADTEFVADNLASIAEHVASQNIESLAPPKDNLEIVQPPASEVNQLEREIFDMPMDSTETESLATEIESDSAFAKNDILITTAESERVTAKVVEKDVLELETPAIQTQEFSESEQDILQQQIQQWQNDFELLEQPNQEITWRQGDQTFHASVDQQAPKNNTGLERAVVEISTEIDGVRLSTQVEFKRLAFSHYAQLIDRWDRDVSLSEDEIVGRFHSNSRLVVAPDRRAEPKFNGKVTVASSVSMRGLRRRSDVFLGGLETRVKPIKLPRQLEQEFYGGNTDPSKDISYSEYVFDQDGTIELLVDGGFNWSTEFAQEYFSCQSPCHIRAAEDTVIGIEGIVSGTVVVFADDTIRITGNLQYQNDPATHAESNDFLGLLSENYIEVAPPAITGPGDITIHGALYAKRRFVVRNFRNRNKGLLSIYGSLTAGSVSATEPRFATRVEFDSRFEEQRLPNFPMTNKYELNSWDKRWTVE